SKEQLIEAALPRLNRFLEHGTTTIEAKSGYGLSVEDEIKSLEVIQELNAIHPMDLVPTFLGAHEVPDEFRSKKEDYIQLIIQEMIPQVVERGLAEFCDVFCEEGVFTIEEARHILSEAKEWGLKLKIHADQLTPGGGGYLAGELGAVSAEHLEYVTSEEIRLMAEKGVIPVLLPGAVFFLGMEKYAPAREMIKAGLPVALATDFNPGSCMTESMAIILTLACIKMKMTPAEVIVASTLNAARAIDRRDSLGSLEVGKKADLVIWDMPDYRHLPYHFGVNLAEIVIKNGMVVWTRGTWSDGLVE
ncbi:MAG: imidazolonepropionase, partial [candidate division KSB1 bacterium]|nr:imidazolonepropionase [candidate division KSB1 bacterium]